MRIKLSKDEVYEIKMPDEIGIIEFRGLVEKFNFLLKNFQRFNITDIPSGNEIILPREITNQRKSQDREKWAFLRNNREIFVKVFKIYYHETPQDFENILEKYNLSFERSDMSCSAMIRLKEFHNLKPIEVGLVKFPNKHEQVNDLRINTDEKVVEKNE